MRRWFAATSSSRRVSYVCEDLFDPHSAGNGGEYDRSKYRALVSLASGMPNLDLVCD